MIPQSTPQDFFTWFAPIADEISKRVAETGDGHTLYPEVLMVQAADECKYNTAGCWHGNPEWKGENNFSGISPNGQLADYATLEEYMDDYVRVITFDAFGYPEVLASTNPELQMIRLGRSEWAGSHYDANKLGRPGVDLVNTYNSYRSIIESAIAVAQHAGIPAPVASRNPATTPAPAETNAAHNVVQTTGDIGFAIAELRDGKKLTRKGWNGKGLWLQLQTPDANSKMTGPYIYIEYPAGHPAYPNGYRIPWLASQTDILAHDWTIIE